MLTELVHVQIYDLIAGMMTARAPHGIDPRGLAEALNMRVVNGELKTAPGRSLTVAIASGKPVRGLANGQRPDGTEDLLAACAGMLWRISGSAATPVSNADICGAITASAATSGGQTILSATSAAKFLGNVKIGDIVYKTTPYSGGAAQFVTVTDVLTDQQMVVSGTLPPEPMSAWSVGSVIADKFTRIKMFMGYWFVVNGSDKPKMWIPATDTWRDVGLAVPPQPALSACSGGDLTASATYTYAVGWGDALGAVGNPCTACTGATDGTKKSFQLTFSGHPPAWVTHWNVYRSRADESTLYHLADVAISATSWLDTHADEDLSASEAPYDHDQPPVSAEDFLAHKDRILWQRGSRIYIGGRDPLDTSYGGAGFAGRYEPWYAPAGRLSYLGRDIGAQKDGKGLFSLRGAAFALQSDSVWRLWDQSDDPNVWQWVLAAPALGCENIASLAWDDENAYWLGRRNGRLHVVRFGGAMDVDLGRDIQPTIDGIADAASACGGVVNGIYRLSFSGADGHMELEYQIDRGDGRGAWNLRDWRHTAYVQGPTYGYGGNSAGNVYRLDHGTTDAGSAILRRIVTPEIRMSLGQNAYREYSKRWRHLAIEFVPTQALSGMSAWARVDEGTWIYLSAWAGNAVPISAAAQTPRAVKGNLPAIGELYGRGFQAKFAWASPSADVVWRGYTVKGLVDSVESD